MIPARRWMAFPLLLPVVAWGAEQADKAEKASPAMPPADVGSIAQVMVALLVVLALILGMAWLLRRVGGIQRGGSGAIRVLGGMSMGQRERVVLVQVGETQLLLGVAPGRVQTLHVLDKPVDVSGPGAGESFSQRLSQALGRG
ncbi:MAG TPA: flagellar biosynthetic protein FliO, partial [Gammaproteobacteria bacterium]|nr:flagellar biosynthetic protein FliO [Gammaproteobacteria bacterium]